VLEEQEDDQDNPKPLMIKYSDFLAAAIDERKYFTREKVNSLIIIFSSGQYSSTSTSTGKAQ
jgi:calcium-dependent protein kinase